MCVPAVPQAKLLLHFPQLMNGLFNSAPHALMRVLMGQPLLAGLPALDSNARVGRRAPLDPKIVRDVVLKNIPKVCRARLALCCAAAGSQR